MMLVTLDYAKSQVRETADYDDAFITLQIHIASGLVMGYLKSQGISSFTDSNGDLILDSNSEAVGVPYEVQGATLFMLAWIFKNRDSDPDKDFEPGYLPPTVMSMLYHLRDPACA